MGDIGGRQSLAAKGSGESATRSSGQHSWELAGHTGGLAPQPGVCSKVQGIATGEQLYARTDLDDTVL